MLEENTIMTECMLLESRAKANARVQVQDSVTLALHLGLSPWNVPPPRKVQEKDSKEYVQIVERWGILRGSAQNVKEARQRAKETTKEKARGLGQGISLACLWRRCSRTLAVGATRGGETSQARRGEHH